jgi:hypothetical protein
MLSSKDPSRAQEPLRLRLAANGEGKLCEPRNMETVWCWTDEKPQAQFSCPAFVIQSS